VECQERKGMNMVISLGKIACKNKTTENKEAEIVIKNTQDKVYSEK
jgi:hypothetical protein